MFSTFFSFLYELTCGSSPDSPEYRQTIFGSVGIFTFIASITVCMLFYLWLGRWRNVWYKRRHWVITIIFLIVAGFFIAYPIAVNEIGYTNGYLIKFAILNGLYAAFYFSVFSFFFKNFSIYSKYTPI